MSDGILLNKFVKLLDEMNALVTDEHNKRLLEISSEIGKIGYHICIRDGEVYIRRRHPADLRYQK